MARHICVEDSVPDRDPPPDCFCGTAWSGRLPGGPTVSSRRAVSTPRYEVTFEPDATDEEIEAFLIRMGIRRPAEPIPDFAECGRPGCDLRAKRLEHGHFGDRPSPYVFEPVHRPDPWGIWPLVLILATVAAIVGLAVEVWR